MLTLALTFLIIVSSVIHSKCNNIPLIRVTLVTSYPTHGRFIGKPIVYGANTYCTYHAQRLILSNDVETNPGPSPPCVNCISNPCVQCNRSLDSIKGLKIAHLNISTLLGEGNCKIDNLRLFVQNNHFHIICINETRLSDKISSEEVHIAGYSIVRHDRNRKGGGSAIYVSDDLDFIHRSELHSDLVESTWVEINLKNSRSIIIGSIYRPPSARVDQLHVNISNHVTNVMDSFSKSDFVITGDFNYDTLTPNLG